MTWQDRVVECIRRKGPMTTRQLADNMKLSISVASVYAQRARDVGRLIIAQTHPKYVWTIND